MLRWKRHTVRVKFLRVILFRDEKAFIFTNSKRYEFESVWIDFHMIWYLLCLQNNWTLVIYIKDLKKLVAIEYCQEFWRFIEARWSLLMLVEAFGYLLKFIELYWCLLKFVERFLSLLSFIEVYCRLMMIDND